MTEYSSTKTRGIRWYYPSDIPQFWNLTSITISLSLKFHSIRESFLWLLQEKVNIVLFIKSYRKPCQAANSKLFVNIFFTRFAKYLEDNSTIASSWRKNAHGYLSLNITCFALALFLELRSVRILHGTNNVGWQIPVHIFPPNWGYCLSGRLIFRE